MLLPLYASLFRALFAHTHIRCVTLTHWCVGRNKRCIKICSTSWERERYRCATHSKRVLASARLYIVWVEFVTRRSISHTLMRCVLRQTLILFKYLAFVLSLPFFLTLFFSLFRRFRSCDYVEILFQKHAFLFYAWVIFLFSALKIYV